MLLEARHLTRRFGPLAAVDDVSLSLSAGDIVGLLGGNGAGKSTLLRMLSGTLAPTGGEIEVDGADLFGGSPAPRAKVGFLPERCPLPLEPTVEEHLLFLSALYGQGGRRAKVRARDAIARCGLGPVRGVAIGLLSQGQRVRCGIAAASLHAPKILVLDEPLAGLDLFQAREIAALLRETAAKAAVILASHQLSGLRDLCTRFLAMRAGRIAAACDATTLLSAATTAPHDLRIEIRPPCDSDSPPPPIALPGISGFHARRRADGWWRLVFTLASAESPSSAPASPPSGASSSSASPSGASPASLAPMRPVPPPDDLREQAVRAVARTGWRLRAIDFIGSPLSAWLSSVIAPPAPDGATPPSPAPASPRP